MPSRRRRAGRRAMIIVAGVVAATVVGIAVYLQIGGVRMRAMVTARRSPAAEERPLAWAAPLERPGLANLFRVGDDLYRGMQPTAEGFEQLRAMGIRTIVNLRTVHSDRDEAGGLGLDYESISFKPWHPETEDVVRFLRIVTDPERTPAFVHCRHGADRTGMMCAVYRIVVEGWTKDEAIREMTEGGFGHHEVWSNLVEFLRDLDIEALKREAGLTAPPTDTPP